MSTMLRPKLSTTPYIAGQRHKFTAKEFNHMGDMGLLEGLRAYLIDGEIRENGPMDPPHATITGMGYEALRSLFGSGFCVRCQMPLTVDEFNDPMPDLAVVNGTLKDYLGTHPTTAELVIEVADSSLQIDTTEKAERYATAGIADYWVLDIHGKLLHVFRDPVALPAGLGATAYRTHQEFGPDDRVSPLAAPNASLLVGDLLP